MGLKMDVTGPSKNGMTVRPIAIEAERQWRGAMDGDERDQAALTIARRTLERERPAELPYFDLQAEPTLRELPTTRLRRGDDAYLGIGGGGETISLLTPVVVALGVKAFDVLWAAAWEDVSKELITRFRVWLAARRTDTPLKLPGELEIRLRNALTTELTTRFPGVRADGIVDQVMATLTENGGADARG
jgi:hypothetical protein